MKFWEPINYRNIISTLFFAAIISPTLAIAQSNIIYDENFSSGLGAFSSSGRVTTGRYGLRLRGGSSSVVDSDVINTSGYDNISISFKVNAVGLDRNESGVAAISLNGGPFINANTVTSSTNSRVTIPVEESNNSTLRLRFSINASSYFERYEISDLVVEGEADGSSNPPPPPPSNADVPERGDFVTFESGQVRPLALSSDGNTLYAVNTPDNRVEVFDVSGNTPRLVDSVLVGLEPVAVALRNDGELWVVNHLSDSVSIIDVSTSPAEITNTLLVGDEPRDIVFAGRSRNSAYITTAHRGQNAPFDPQLTREGIGRADVWVFDGSDIGESLGGTPITILNMFGDTPRALAVNADGTRVYAAILNSGNRTTVLTDDRGEGGINKPSPSTDDNGNDEPETGLIVQYDGRNWKDNGDPTRNIPGSNWDDRVNISLPDYDVFTIDASRSVPRVINETSGVGTTLFNMAVNPVNGNLYVSNQEARNVVRFEGPGTRSTTVNGHFVESRITVIDGNNVNPRHLNKHINYNTSIGTTSERSRSLATPLEMAVSDNGNDLYVVAMGSNKLARFSTSQLENNTFNPSTENHLVLTGGGPTGVVLDDNRDRAYVLTRFDNGISVVNTSASLGEISHITMFNPEPAIVKNGRRFMYDANYTSSRGDSSCSGCHIFGDMDHLAWDLGNPDDITFRTPNVYNENIPFFGRNRDVHPMKGPMTTQSFRGMKGNGPMHWRGDRTGQSASFGETLEEQAFEDFNVAFVGLLGRESELTENEMDAFAKFALELTYPPNPIANLDNSLTPRQQQALQIYNTVTSDIISTCNGCHRLDVNLNQFGTDGTMATEGPGVAEDMKIPHLRNMYQKVGMFGVNSQLNEFPFLGDQIRGFGFDNAGSHGTIFDFLSEDVFTLNDNDTRLVEELSLAFPSEMNPIVGQQVTVTPNNRNRSDITNRLDLLVERALVINPRPECELVASTVLASQRINWVMNGNRIFVANDESQPALSLNGIEDLTEENAVTFTCVPPGNGTRVGVDRDGDGVFDANDSH
ncbi:MAG: YncE family protein [Cellvibrionaceae bacterium]